MFDLTVAVTLFFPFGKQREEKSLLGEEKIIARQSVRQPCTYTCVSRGKRVFAHTVFDRGEVVSSSFRQPRDRRSLRRTCCKFSSRGWLTAKAIYGGGMFSQDPLSRNIRAFYILRDADRCWNFARNVCRFRVLRVPTSYTCDYRYYLHPRREKFEESRKRILTMKIMCY